MYEPESSREACVTSIKTNDRGYFYVCQRANCIIQGNEMNHLLNLVNERSQGLASPIENFFSDIQIEQLIEMLQQKKAIIARKRSNDLYNLSVAEVGGIGGKTTILLPGAFMKGPNMPSGGTFRELRRIWENGEFRNMFTLHLYCGAVMTILSRDGKTFELGPMVITP